MNQMLKFSFKKISRAPESFFKKRKEISSYLAELTKILREEDYSRQESFLLLPQKANSLTEISPSYYNKFNLILLCGVGGSSLGTQAVYGALKDKKTLAEILILDSLNPLLLRKALNKARDTAQGGLAVFFISKSGKTFETTANFFALFPIIKKYNPEFFIISDENSLLWKFGKKNNFPTFSMPEKVVGRYSVFSLAHVLPLAFSGAKVKELLLGAEQAVRDCLIDDYLKNPALASALTIFYHYQKRKNIYSNLVFPPDLEYFGRWYQQLMAESLGKKNKGITPTVTVGTTDFHSLGQLYFDGPPDKFINFVFAENLDVDYEIGELPHFDQIFPGMSGQKIWQFNRTIFEGIKKAYIKQKLPFSETILANLDEENLGYLFQMKMMEIIFLAKLMKVNAFNQPAVELYKKETRKILQGRNS